MKGFVDLAYRLPYVEYYKDFDHGFYVDFHQQLKRMGEWLKEHGCRTTLDIGAMTGGCIEYISGLGIRMDGVQFTEDIKRLAASRLRKAGIKSTLYVSPVHTMPPCDHTGVPIHFHSSTISGSAWCMISRTFASVFPRQSPSSAILFRMSSDADWPWLAPEFFMFSPQKFQIYSSFSRQ